MLVRGRLAGEVDVALPDRADRRAAERRRAHRAAAATRGRGRGRPPAAPAVRGPDGERDARASTPASCSSAPRRAPTGSTASSPATSAASSSPAPTPQAAGWPLHARPLPAGDDACRACSSPATCAPARSSAWPARSARARWRSRSSTSTWSRHERDRTVTLADLRPSTCSTTSTTPSSQQWAAVAQPRDARSRATCVAEQGEPMPRAASCCSRARAQALAGRRRPRRAGRPPASRRPGWARSRCSPSGRSACACVAETDVPRGADRAPTTSAGWRSPQPSVHRAGDAPGRAGDEPRHGDRAEPRAAGLAGHDGRRAWPTSSTTRPRPRAARAAQLAEALDVVSSTLAQLRRGRRRARRGRRSCVELQQEALDRAAAQHRARRARRRRRRGRAARRASRTSASPRPGGWPSRWPPPASTTPGCDRVADAGRPGDGRRARAGWRPR